MPEPEYARVLDKSTGHKLSLIASSVAHTDAYEVLDEPAVGLDGLPLAPEHATTPPTDVDLTEIYLSRTAAALKEDVAARNADRVDEDLIVVEAPGNKPQLAAALAADDLTHNSPAPSGQPATTEKENHDA